MQNKMFQDNNENRDVWYSLVNGLMLVNTENFFRAVYDAIQQHPTYVILSDFEEDRKLFILERMLKFYEEREDFEKCKVIFDIKNQVETNVNN